MVKKSKKLKRILAHQKKKERPPGSPRTSPILQKALTLHQAGSLQQAEAFYRQVLQQEPDHPEALHFLGVLAYEVGKSEIAVELMSRALTLKPDYVAAHYNLGNALQELGRLDEAVASYRRALTLKPDYVEAYYNLGILLQTQGRPDDAATAFRHVVDLKPDFAEAHNNLGIALQAQDKLDEAIASFRRVLELKPDYAAAHNNLGLILKASGRLNEAVVAFQRALELQPDYGAAYNNLGATFKDQGNLNEAIVSFKRVLELKPDYAEAQYNLSIALKDQGKPEEAEASFRQALKLKPDYVEAHNNLGGLLKDQGRMAEAITCYRRALALRQDYAEVHSNLLFCLNYLPDHSISGYLDEARNYGRQVAARVSSRYSDWICAIKPERLSVGLVSGDIRNHPVGYFLENILANIDPNTIELIGYPTNRGEDEFTARLRSHFFAWRPLTGQDDAAAARLIHEDGVHVLLDLSGHTSSNRLPVFAWKPAPVQATWLGYFASTGVAEMDYIIADPVSVPESHQQHFTEKVWYLPETRFCFSPPVTDRPLMPTPLPGLHNGYITFGCFQNFTKIYDEVLEVWGRIFEELPQARLRLQNSMLNSQAMRDLMIERLARCGITPERITLEKAVPRTEYLAAHACIDIILDTFPATGGTTTCEALWMGVPTVTLAGNTMLGRESASQLSCAGLADWIAVDNEEYITKAVTHAADLEKLSRLRAGLRRQVLESPLFDGPRFARNFEAAMWGMWHRFTEDLDKGSSD